MLSTVVGAVCGLVLSVDARVQPRRFELLVDSVPDGQCKISRIGSVYGTERVSVSPSAPQAWKNRTTLGRFQTCI